MKKEKTAIERFDSLPSTNDYAKAKRSEGKSLIVVAKTQPCGRGTKGRSFDSALGGLYMSKLSFYKDLPTNQAFKIMQNAAAAVCETLAHFGVKPYIKWPNDVFVNGKKICGILIENTFSGGYVRSSVVGIGLNVHNVLPDSLQDVATTLYAETGKTVSVAEVEKVLTEKLEESTVAEKYTKYLGLIGENVTLICGENAVRATLIGVDGEGNLLARTANGEERFSSAEVSLRSDV